MKYRKLGKSELIVSEISFGAWQIGDSAYWASDTQSDQEQTVHAALDMGINLIDTAEAYGDGESESVLGRALDGRRDSILLASKVLPENCTPERVRQSCEASLRRLRTDRIDLYQIHWPFRDVPFDSVYDELARLRDEGKIREVGLSNFGPQDLSSWLNTGECVSNQIAYNLAFRVAEKSIIPWCLDNGLGVLAYSPLLQGVLSCRWSSSAEIPKMRRRTRHFKSARTGSNNGHEQHELLLFDFLDGLRELGRELDLAPAALALSWLVRRPGVTSVILGARNVAQLERNLQSAVVSLPEWAVARLEAMSMPLKKAMGTNADLWRSGSEGRVK